MSHDQMWEINSVPVPILAYHKVSNRLEWGINTIPIRAFKSQITYLYQKNYYSISLQQYLADNFPKVTGKNPVIITFDDADESVYQHAFPIMRDCGFRATVFTITNYIGKRNTWDANLGGIYSRHLSWNQIEQLSDQGWEIGSHTASHRDLLRLSSEEVAEELQLSRETLSQKLKQPIQFVSYPFNRVDLRVITLTKKAGYLGGCALSVSKNYPGSLRQYIIPRHGVYAIDTRFSFKRKLLNSKIEQLKQRIISGASMGTIWYKRLNQILGQAAKPSPLTGP